MRCAENNKKRGRLDAQVISIRLHQKHSRPVDIKNTVWMKGAIGSRIFRNNLRHFGRGKKTREPSAGEKRKTITRWKDYTVGLNRGVEQVAVGGPLITQAKGRFRSRNCLKGGEKGKDNPEADKEVAGGVRPRPCPPRRSRKN